MSRSLVRMYSPQWIPECPGASPPVSFCCFESDEKIVWLERWLERPKLLKTKRSWSEFVFTILSQFSVVMIVLIRSVCHLLISFSSHLWERKTWRAIDRQTHPPTLIEWVIPSVVCSLVAGLLAYLVSDIRDLHVLDVSVTTPIIGEYSKTRFGFFASLEIEIDDASNKIPIFVSWKRQN